MEISTEILGAIVTAIATVTASIFAGLLGRNWGTSKSVKEFHARQLDIAYEPMMAIFLTYGPILPGNAFKELSTILTTHNSVIAPCLVEAWQAIHPEEGEPVDCSVMFKMLDSNYNWVKKSLGYPCREDKIDLKVIPSRSLHIIGNFAAGIFFVLMMIVSLLSLRNVEPLWLKVELVLLFLLSYAISYACLRNWFKAVSAHLSKL
ncbi:MAG: hypothetical protein LUG47_05810 [Clostridiales bacterium]|nr:hypothetical protein [Clostridiales bacterium]